MLSGEFDAVDMDLAEVIEEFSLEPNSTSNEGSSSEFVSDIFDEFDAVDVDIAEVTEEFSLEPNSAHDAVALTLPGHVGGGTQHCLARCYYKKAYMEGVFNGMKLRN